VVRRPAEPDVQIRCLADYDAADAVGGADVDSGTQMLAVPAQFSVIVEEVTLAGHRSLTVSLGRRGARHAPVPATRRPDRTPGATRWRPPRRRAPSRFQVARRRRCRTASPGRGAGRLWSQRPRREAEPLGVGVQIPWLCTGWHWPITSRPSRGTQSARRLATRLLTRRCHGALRKRDAGVLAAGQGARSARTLKEHRHARAAQTDGSVRVGRFRRWTRRLWRMLRVPRTA